LLNFVIVIGIKCLKLGENRNNEAQNRKWSFGNSYRSVLFYNRTQREFTLT